MASAFARSASARLAVALAEAVSRKAAAADKKPHSGLAAFAVAGLLVAGIGLYGVVAMSVAARPGTGDSNRARSERRRNPPARPARSGSHRRDSAPRSALGARGDTPTWAAMVVILAAAGLTAAWLPARRAGRVDPIEALRQE